jgi:NADH:quinone reductase (non-electrogenic)
VVPVPARAIGRIGRIRVAGFSAWLLWLVVHLVGLPGFKSRGLEVAQWTIAFLGRCRAEPVITEQQVFGRRALEATAAPEDHDLLPLGTGRAIRG